MSKKPGRLNDEVTQLLDRHPLRKEIDLLRQIILDSVSGLTENVKWNGPNYCFAGDDRVTMRIQPPGQIQLIFHRGAKKLKQPKARLIDGKSELLVWKENDRAIVTFKSMLEIENARVELETIVKKWIIAAK